MTDISDLVVPGEEILLAGRPHIMSRGMSVMVAAGIVAAGVCIEAGPAALSRLLPALDPLWRLLSAASAPWQGSFPGGQIAGFAAEHAGKGLVLLGLAVFGWAVIRCACTVYVVTARRVLVCEGVLSRGVSEMTGNTIRAVELSQGIAGGLFGYGTVFVHGFAMDRVVIVGAPAPMHLLRAVESIQI